MRTKLRTGVHGHAVGALLGTVLLAAPSAPSTTRATTGGPGAVEAATARSAFAPGGEHGAAASRPHLVPAAPVHITGPPPGHTGGFAEPTCQACHSEFPLDLDGAVSLEGLPEAYRPGEIYPVTVVLRSTDMARAGFQAAVRFAEGEGAGRQAGTLEPLDDRIRVVRDTASAVRYVQHTERGTQVTDPELATWTFQWTAPTHGGPVVFHVAANSGNGDNSPFGDLIYQAERRVEGR